MGITWQILMEVAHNGFKKNIFGKVYGIIEESVYS
jgi:hypothetical protein